MSRCWEPARERAQAIPGFDPSAHRIAVHAECTRGGRVEISVSDSGLGIPEHALPHVFDAFASGKRRGDGSGLGLTITKRIVESLHGSIRIESTVGKGTTVRVELPSARRPTQTTPNARLDTPIPTEAPVRVWSRFRSVIVAPWRVSPRRRW